MLRVRIAAWNCRTGGPRKLLLRQLKDAPDGLRVDCWAAHARGASTSELLKAARENPALLINDPKPDLRTFRVALAGPMGAKRRQGRGSFLGSVLDLLDGFYESTVQTIKPWTAAPPKLRPDQPDPEEAEDVPDRLVSTSLSSQDGSAAPDTDHHPAAHVLAPLPSPPHPEPAAAPFGAEGRARATRGLSPPVPSIEP